jgi:hypothetical protein
MPDTNAWHASFAGAIPDVDSRSKLMFTVNKRVQGAPVKMRNMAFVAIPLFLGLSCSGQANPKPVLNSITAQKPNYTITITPPSGSLSLKSPLLIEMYYTNTTTSDIYMNVESCKICTPQHIVLKKDGKEVETTPFQRMSTGRGSPSDLKDIPKVTLSGHVQHFHPGVFWKFNLDLRTLYNITEPGQYTVSASRTENTTDGKVTVDSNVVTLNIVP